MLIRLLEPLKTCLSELSDTTRQGRRSYRKELKHGESVVYVTSSMGTSCLIFKGQLFPLDNDDKKLISCCGICWLVSRVGQ